MIREVWDMYNGLPVSVSILVWWGLLCAFSLIYPPRRSKKISVLLLAASAVLLFFSGRIWEAVDIYAIGNVSLTEIAIDFIFMIVFTLFFLAIIRTDLKRAVDMMCRTYILSGLILSATCVLYLFLLTRAAGAELLAQGGIVFEAVALIALACFLEKRLILPGCGKSLPGSELAVIISLVAMTAVLSYLSYNTPGVGQGFEQMLQFYINRTLIFFSVTVVFYLVKIARAENESKAESAQLQNMLELQYQQYLDYRETSSRLAVQAHDMKHQINALRNAFSEAERESYLDELERTVKKYEMWSSTGNSVLDTILMQKKQVCLAEDIEFTCMADGKLLKQLEARDLCALLGNLLDNALEKVMTYTDPADRVVHMEIVKKLNFVSIRVSNVLHGELDTKNYVDGLPVTTKPDRERHGIGLKSVRQIVEKYRGTMSIETEGGWFAVHILIPEDRPE